MIIFVNFNTDSASVMWNQSWCNVDSIALPLIFFLFTIDPTLTEGAKVMLIKYHCNVESILLLIFG